MIDELRDLLDCKKNWISLSEVALRDGKITMDEFLLIRNFVENLERYLETLENAIEDGIIDDTEKAKLFELRAHMLHEVIEIANTDRMITPDEFTLLQEINELLEIVDKVEKQLS